MGEERLNGLNKYHLTFLLVCVGVLTILVTTSIYVRQTLPDNIVETKDLEYFFKVGSYIGFDLGTDILRMGSVTRGSASERTLNISQSSADRVYIRVLGDGRRILWPEYPDYPLINGSAKVKFIAHPSDSSEYGDYKGVVRLYFYNVNN